MEFKGTKGEWFMMKGGFSKKYDDPNLIQIYATNENLEMICKVHKDQILHNDVQDFEANAKLIAAAPEMFVILKSLSIVNHKIPKWILDEINELLTKITK